MTPTISSFSFLKRREGSHIKYWIRIFNIQIRPLSLPTKDLPFQAGEQVILDIGKANLGDKTLIDALSPAVKAIEAAEKEGKALAAALADFEQAARKGTESTKDMLAKMGRASRLGERTIDHQDAGATACYFILRSLASAMSR
ncbi:MAG: dihydroxyacetone kinase subunit L [Desulfobacterales bacterium]|nr:dihydroxyacetone kinase subunit L [Desulfobacterales bacterium]